MLEKMQIKNSTLGLVRGDITDLEIDSFVFYAENDLSLGSGFGSAINLRGGPSIRSELEKLGPLKVTEAAVTSAGDMKAGFIIHAVGPKFQEEDTEQKLKATIDNALRLAEEKGIKSIAFPPMGAGFYGVPLDVSARITVRSIAEFLKNASVIKDIVICTIDKREYSPFQNEMKNLVSPEQIKTDVESNDVSAIPAATS
ncbi:MAG: macro domain-containing protein [Thermodesulfovibrionia bacterium]|nr:macro domain-containing protein [Thermodesulfovibrionia bacterium]